MALDTPSTRSPSHENDHSILSPPVEQFTAQVESWAKEFEGDYEIQIFGERVTVLTSVEDIRQVLALRPSKFLRGLTPASQAGVCGIVLWDLYYSHRMSQIVQFMLHRHGPALTQLNRRWRPAYGSLIPKIAERFCAKLGGHADTDEVVDAKKYFAHFTRDIIAFMVCDIDVDSTGSTDDDPSLSYRAIQSAFNTLDVLQFNAMKIIQWKYLPSLMPWVQRAKKHSCQLGTIVQTTRSSDSAGSDRMKFSDDEVLHEVKSLFLAGTDTTSLNLCWAMYYLAKNPVTFARCRNEGLKAAPMSRGMVSTLEQLDQLVFCAAVFREVVRLRTSGPTLFHTCMEDHTTNKGFKIKTGQGVVLLTRFASISEENFTRGAEFIPERWIESERDEALLGKGVECDKKSDVRHMDDAFLGFGSGPRACPGKNDPPEEVVEFTTGPETMELKFKRNEDAST